jgi:hypothetical protein
MQMNAQRLEKVSDIYGGAMIHHAYAAIKAVQLANRGLDSAIDWMFDKHVTLTVRNNTDRRAMMAFCVSSLMGPPQVVSYSYGYEFIDPGTQLVDRDFCISQVGSDVGFYWFLDGGIESRGPMTFYIVAGSREFGVSAARSERPAVVAGSGTKLYRVSGASLRVKGNVQYDLG